MITETSTIKESLGERIKRLMDFRGLSKADLSKETGVPVVTIEYLVDGSTYNPRVATLLAIADYLHVSLDYLVGSVYGRSQAVVQSRSFQIEKSTERQVPLLEWEDVEHWCKHGYNFLKDIDIKWVASQQVVSKEAFALTITDQAEGVFPRDSIMIVDPRAQSGPFDYVLATMCGGSPCIKKIVYENDEIYLNSVVVNLHSEEVFEDKKVIGKIVELYNFFAKTISKR